MEWIEDREPLDVASVGRAVGIAFALTIALTLFVVLVLAGMVSWAAGAVGV